jgi:hypothetical protein
MFAALIPPTGLESYALHSNFHLALPLPKLLRNISYVRTYQRAADSGEFVILDNGMAEGVKVHPDSILEAAHLLRVKEIVLPDVLRHASDTVEAVERFYAKYNSRLEGYNLMAVAQGITMPEFRGCVHHFANQDHITTIGIPRLMMGTLNNGSARIEFANWIEEKYPGRFLLHLLGADANYRKEIKWAAKYAEHIRSTDSSMPFNYALAGRSLSDHPAVINRPEGYFDRSWAGKVNVAFVKANIDTYKGWVDGRDASASNGELPGVPTVQRAHKVRPLAAPFNP